MQLTQQQADRLIALVKEAARTDVFDWLQNTRQDELLIAKDDGQLHFVLSLRRNPYEIRLHCRTRDRNIGLVRLDASNYHINPDGTEIRGKPHLHIYREGHELSYAKPVDWYDVAKPIETLERFLKVVHSRFPFGIQQDMF